MIEVVEISYSKGGKKYLTSPGKYKLKKGVTVIVDTDIGLQFGMVETSNFNIKPSQLTKSLDRVIRISNKEDFKNHKRNKTEAKKALKKCNDLIKKYKLNMNIVDAYFTFDRNQLIFRFTSDNRIDFRSLAKELAAIYKTRIELRQIGIRDKAQEMGGCGQCGRQLCCKTFLKDFNSVSINMAKNQNIALNPNKINGACGRLLCCLNYEDECYTQYRKNLPYIGKTVDTSHGKGKVISVDVLKQTYRVDVENYGIVECGNNESN